MGDKNQDTASSIRDPMLREITRKSLGVMEELAEQGCDIKRLTECSKHIGRLVKARGKQLTTRDSNLGEIMDEGMDIMNEMLKPDCDLKRQVERSKSFARMIRNR